jgi:hypothetical protein
MKKNSAYLFALTLFWVVPPIILTSSTVMAQSSIGTLLGRNYNATGNISCSIGEGQPTESCFFGVIRQGNGSGIVTVKKPDGRSRAIIFKNGKAEGYEQSEVDTDRFSSSKQGDLNIIRIGPERYEIPDAIVLGG